jgi:Ca-activated chloride channel family protein
MTGLSRFRRSAENRDRQPREPPRDQPGAPLEMSSRMRHLRPLLLALLLPACGATDDAASSSPTGGGDVSFGGAEDIGELRSTLAQGGIPSPESLDANGFFNEHYRAPPLPTCEGLLCLTPGMTVGSDWLTSAPQLTMQLAISTPVDPSTYQRPPLRLVVVVDHSGSMASDGRLDKVKVGLHALIDNLQDVDRLALVEFDDQIDVDARFTDGPLDRASLHAIVDGLEPRGSTDIYDGLQAGFALLEGVSATETQERVIFLSDGLATWGDTSTADIMGMAAGYVKQGIGLTTVGVGNQFDVDLMRGLAEQGSGNFYFLEDPTAATEVFTEELDYFTVPLALDVEIDATAGNGYLFGEVVGTTKWTSAAHSGSMQIPAVFLASRTSSSGGLGRRGGGSMIFVHLVPVSGLPDDGGKVADLTLSYRVPGQTTRTTQQITLAYAPDASAPSPYLSTPELAPRYAMYNVFLGLRLATRSDPACAIAALTATRENAVLWLNTHDDPDLTDDVTLIDEYLANLQAASSYTYTTTTETPSPSPSPATCGLTTPYDPPPEPPPPTPVYYPGGYTYTPHNNYVYACSVGKPDGAAWIVAALFLGLRRRRR